MTAQTALPPPEGRRARFYQRLSAQLVFVALLPILIVSVVIGVPLIEGRRAQLLAQERLRAEQAAQTAELIYRERLAFAELLARLLADRPVLVQSLSASDLESMQDFVRQTRNDTLFDLVTVVDADGRVLAQDGLVSLWRPEFGPNDTPLFWGVPELGLVVQVSAPIVLDGSRQATFVGSFLIDRALLAYVRAQTDLDQSVLFDSQLVATSLTIRPRASSGPLTSIGNQARETPRLIEVSIVGVPYLAHYLALNTANEQPMGTVEVLLPLTPLRNAQTQATIVLLAGTLLVAGIAVVLAWYLAQRLISPIRQLGAAAEAIGSGVLEQPVVARGPQEILVLGCTLDHMRRQLAESRDALQAEKARYSNILEAVEEAVIVLDPDERVTSLNRSAEVMLGWDRASAIGRALGEVVQYDDERPLRLLQIPRIGAIQLALRTRRGERLLAAATRSVVVAVDGVTPNEHVVVLRDVSEEEAVRNLKDAFLTNVTHEFRTPLAALIASLEILRDEHEVMTPEERGQMLDALHIGVQRLDTLVQNLLDSASIQGGYFRVLPDVAALVPLIEEATDVMQPLLQQREQTLVVRLPDALGPVLADGERIVQVLVNLLSNASKFGPRRDHIELTVAETPGAVAVSVTDHGPGIVPERQSRLFERFLRPGSGTVHAQGAGLGLAIVKAIVERHGGEVRVQSDERGTTFTFTLLAADGVHPHVERSGAV